MTIRTAFTLIHFPDSDLPPESGPVFMLGLVNNEVVGIADEKVRAFLKFFIQIIQEDVGK